MVKYVLKYFPVRGRAEVARLIFAYCGVEYEDVRIPPAEWPNSKHKEDAPLGQLPVLEMDDKVLCQSMAITRYLARKFGLAGQDDLEAYYVDMFIDCFNDLDNKFPLSEKNDQKRVEIAASGRLHESVEEKASSPDLVKEFFDKTVPEAFRTIESLLIAYNGGDGFFVSKLSIADFTLLNHVDFLLPKKPDLLDGLPKLEGICRRVRAIPQIADWIAKRPVTEL